MIKSIGKLLVFPAVLLVAVSAYAWTEPSLAPTGGNVSAPLRNPLTSSLIMSGKWTIANPGVWGAKTLEIHDTLWDGSSNGNYGDVAAGHGFYYNGLQSGGSTGYEAGSGQLYVSNSVGVGTANYTYPLNISGDANVTGCYRVNGTCLSSGTSYWTFAGGQLTPNVSAIVRNGTTPNPTWGSFIGDSFNTNTIYAFNALCSGNDSGYCGGANGVVIGSNNTLAKVNIPNSGVAFFNQGSVGVGTTVPIGKFSVNDGANRNIGILTDATQMGSSGMALGSFTDGGAAYAPLALVGSVIGINGSVGIGNISPGYKLDVTGSLKSTDSYFDTLNTIVSGDPLEINYRNSAPTVICASVGCGTISGYFDTNGNVGIGMNSPTAKLDVAGKVYIGEDPVSHDTPYKLLVEGDVALGGIDGVGSLYAQKVYFNSALSFGVGPTPACVSMMTGRDNLQSQIGRCTSLAKFKKNIEDLNLGLNTVMQLHPVSFDWKDPKMGGHDLGFIAEEVNKVDPMLAEYTSPGPGGVLSGVKYSQMSALLVKAVQELNVKVDKLQTENDDLRVRIEALEAKIK